MGVMIAPLEKQFGWSRAEITSGLLIISAVMFPLSFLMGMAIDRFGPRRIALFGMALYGVALMGLSQAQQPIWTWWAFWMLLACGYLFLGPTVWVAAIATFFSASRGLAIAAMLCATGLISFCCPPLTQLFIEHFGWRVAYAIWGGVAVGFAFPTLYFLFPDTPVADRSMPKARAVDEAISDHGLSVGEILRSSFFWRLALAGPVMSLVFTSMIVNFVPILTTKHIPVSLAATIAGLAGAMILVGRLTGGSLNDHFNPRRVAAVIVLFPIASCLLLISDGGRVSVAIVAVLLFGLSGGAELDSLAYLASRYFGRHNFGLLFGVIMGLSALGSGLGPFLTSAIFDRTGSYGPAMWLMIPLCLLSSYSFSTLGDYPQRGSGGSSASS